MTSLIKYAEALAAKPPVDVYRKLMKLASDEQLSKLGPEPGQNEHGWAEYQKEKKERLAVASKYEDMVKTLGADVAKFSVMSICDFAAMCTMMIAAGSNRIEALKAALRGKKSTTVVQTNAGDKAYRFDATPDDPKADNPGAFEEILRGWREAKDQGNGAVQFKFPAGGDFHTFAVERISAKNAENKFIVYQAYQNTYSLAHFLGLSPSNDKTLDSYHRQVWQAAQESKKGDVAVYKKYDSYYNNEVKRQFRNITTVATNIGSKQQLNGDELKVRVIRPLANMLRGEIQKKVYVDLTGSSTKSVGIKADFMMVLMCNQVSPDGYEENCEALYGVPADLTGYVD